MQAIAPRQRVLGSLSMQQDWSINKMKITVREQQRTADYEVLGLASDGRHLFSADSFFVLQCSFLSWFLLLIVKFDGLLPLASRFLSKDG